MPLFHLVWFLWLGLFNTVLSKSSKSGCLCLVPDLRGKVFWFSTLTDVSYRLVIYGLYIYVELFFFSTHFVEHFFYQNRCWILSKAFFCIYWDNHMIFIHFVNVVYHIDWLTDIEPSLHFCNKSWYMILLTYCWIRVANNLLRIFSSMFLRAIGL